MPGSLILFITTPAHLPAQPAKVVMPDQAALTAQALLLPLPEALLLWEQSSMPEASSVTMWELCRILLTPILLSLAQEAREALAQMALPALLAWLLQPAQPVLLAVPVMSAV
jgi:hypothetical protein